MNCECARQTALRSAFSSFLVVALSFSTGLGRAQDYLYMSSVKDGRETESSGLVLSSYLSDTCCGGVDCGSSCETAYPSKVDLFLPRSNVPLPFLAELATSRGVTLPLPLGVGVISTNMERIVGVSDVRLGLNGSPPVSIERVSVADLEADTSNIMTRYDVWLMPCLNLYGLLGYTEVDAVANVTVEQFPLPVSAPFSFPVDVHLEGTTYGGGATTAIGTKDYFLSLDVNYTKTNFDSLASKMTALVITPRVGKVVDLPYYKGEIHVGAMYQDTEQTVEIIRNQPGVGTLRVSIDEYEPHPVNFLFGTLWALEERLHAIAEVGLGGRTYVITGLTVRF